MASLDWDKCLGLTIGASSVAVGAFVGAWKALPPGGRVSWQSAVLLAVSTAFFCAALVLAGLAIVRHPRWQRWRKRKTEDAEQLTRERVEREELLRDQERRVVWQERCRAWEEFSYAASQFVGALDGFRYDGSPGNWYQIMAIKMQAALSLVEALPPAHREEAKEHLQRFENRRDLTSTEFQSDLMVFRDWLSRGDRYYRDKKAHLPSI